MEVPEGVSYQAAQPTAAARPRHLGKESSAPDMPDTGEELTFDDLIDLINPLQHLPIVSTIYRAFSGDQIRPAVQVMGGLLFGGPSGFVSATGQVLFEAIAGKSIGDEIAELITGEPGAPAAAVPTSQVQFSGDQSSSQQIAKQPFPSAAQIPESYLWMATQRGSHQA